MIRSTSSDTFAIRAMASISFSVNFGLLNTDAEIILFGSRMRMARISRDPLTAAFSRSEKPILAICCEMLSRAASPAAPSGMFGASAGANGPVSMSGSSPSLGRASPGSTPRLAKKSRVAAAASDRAR